MELAARYRLVRAGGVRGLGRQPPDVLPAAAPRGLAAAAVEPPRRVAGAHQPYTIPVARALLWIWRDVTGDPGTRQYALTTAIFAVVAFVIAITHVYETVFLLRDWESDRLRSARLEQARSRLSSRAWDARSIRISCSTTSTRSRTSSISAASAAPGSSGP